MPSQNTNLADKTGGLVESFRNYQPRVVFFSIVIAGLLGILVAGLAYQQIFKEALHSERERIQSSRVTVTPGPRGEISDRFGRVLVANQHRLSVVLELGKLSGEIYRQKLQIRANYKEYVASDTADPINIPSDAQMNEIARVTVAQKYLDEVNAALGRDDKIRAKDLLRHFSQELLLPYVLIDDLTDDEFARLLEHIPIDSPVQVAKSAVREYPYGSAAAHVLGSVKWESDIDQEETPETADLITFKSKGIVGRTGIEAQFDSMLTGAPGTEIIRVNPSGRKIETLKQVMPTQGENLTTSLDIDLQTVGEKAFPEITGGLKGAFVALDVNTGEVLAMASFPNYNLQDVSPRISEDVNAKINEEGGWLNRAKDGLYFPGSTFKLLVSIAGMRSGALTPESHYTATGSIKVGNTIFNDASGEITGDMDYRVALEHSVNSYFIYYGLRIGSDAISAEANRMHLTAPTGFNLPENGGSYVGNDAWKRKRVGEPWTPGDTANISIGQGYVYVTPLQMACFVASLARGETYTRPYITHDPNRPSQHTDPIDLTPAQYAAIVEGMVNVVSGQGTAQHYLVRLPELKTPGLTVAGKTGTAQLGARGSRTENGWYVCFAPVEKPQIAIVCVVEGDTIGESTAGGRYAAPVAHTILKKWWDKQNRVRGTVSAPSVDR